MSAYLTGALPITADQKGHGQKVCTYDDDDDDEREDDNYGGDGGDDDAHDDEVMVMSLDMCYIWICCSCHRFALAPLLRAATALIH